MMFLKLDGVKGESKDGLGSLIAAGIFVAFALMAARVDAATIPEEIATLQAEVAALQSQVNTQKGHISTLQSQVTAQQNQLTVARPVLALAPFVSVDPNPEINVTGPI
jgi:septal ring factor EnvC (AmiA/AmiB activator)